MSEETLYKIALSMIPGVGPVNARILVSYCGGVEAIFKEKKSTLIKIDGIGETTADNVKAAGQILSEAEKQLEFLEANHSKALFFLDKNYPERLKHLKDAPILLYFKGEGDLNEMRTLGVVGTRKPTEEGKAITEQIVRELKEFQVQIISGLAYGVDIAAHRSCVRENMSTIGVMGTGLDKIYPSVHSQTAEKMCDLGGLLSEFPINTKPDAVHFPMRNRIIAGLSDAVLVVESALKGGSMITAEMAVGYSKDVFAIPGRIQDLYSRGCNHLIKHQKAQLVESAEEIALYMQWDTLGQMAGVQQSLFIELDEHEQEVTALLSPDIDVSIDKIYKSLTWPPSRIASILLNLEFKGVVRSLPGKRYILAQ